MVLRETYSRDLQNLQDELLRVGGEVEDDLVKAVTALIERNLSQSRQVITADFWINEWTLQMTMDSLTLIATQQPAAGDLRLLTAVMNIANELERIHDYIKGIGKISLTIGRDPIPADITQYLPAMAAQTRSMLRRALAAFAQQDTAAARQIAAEDDAVDALFNQTRQAIMPYIIANPARFEELDRIGWANHNLERAADRVSNICEWVVYLADGRFVELV
ncbi:MAG TPA: phosphate signaling complex protein PhoU [Anaerolineae bacterium]|nr:phosphate signaling complex protein PhoU [Anaerolineae bacterium]